MAEITVETTAPETTVPKITKIAFVSNRDGNQEIYVMNSDGSGVVRLTNNSAEDGGPVWSPDDSRIAFNSYRDGNWEIYVINSDGTGQVNLTNNKADDGGPVYLKGVFLVSRW